MKTKLFAAMLAFSLSCSHEKTGVDPRLTMFATQKHKQAEEFAASLGVRLRPELRGFFNAAEKGDLDAIEKRWDKIWPRVGLSERSTHDPVFNNILWIPAHETFFAYDQFLKWDPALLQKFADGILGSLPADCIYFGGTDPGRFVITIMRDLAGTTNLYIVTQNALADSRYLEYVRRSYGSDIWIPSESDAQQAFAKFVEELKTRERMPGEDVIVKEGRVSVQGVAGVMAVNAILTKMIFDNNKDKHAFHVEESYVISWMYPHMEPHGLILKLNSAPLEKLDAEVVSRDRQYWDQLGTELHENPAFQRCYAAQSTFAKLRSAIGGVYSFRKMMAEAEYAFRQAVDFCPASPEANYRLAQLHVEVGRFDDAIDLLEKYQWIERPDLNNQQNEENKRAAQGALAQVKELKRQAAEIQTK